MLPIGFDLLPAYKLKQHTSAIDQILKSRSTDEPTIITSDVARTLLSECFAGHDDDKSKNIGHGEDEMQSAVTYLTEITKNPDTKNKLYILVRTGRNVARVRSGGRLENSPDTEQREGEIAKRYATDVPVLIMLKQNGEESQGWRAGPFWWPILLPQSDIHPAIYASEVQE